MKITKSQLKQIIKEEINNILKEGVTYAGYPEGQDKARIKSSFVRELSAAVLAARESFDQNPYDAWAQFVNEVSVKIDNIEINLGLAANDMESRKFQQLKTFFKDRIEDPGHNKDFQSAKKGILSLPNRLLRL